MPRLLSNVVRDLSSFADGCEDDEICDIQLPGGNTVSLRSLTGKLFRGCTLLRNATAWKNPVAGKDGKMQPLRGLQWRLVMAYSGYEQIEGAVFPKDKRRRRGQVYADYIDSIELDTFLQGPILKGKALQRAESEDPRGEQLAEFLEVNKSRREAFISWLHGEDLSTLSHAALTILVLSQLRHLTAHGALSASRAHELGLDQSFKIGPKILSSFAVRLIDDNILKGKEH